MRCGMPLILSYADADWKSEAGNQKWKYGNRKLERGNTEVGMGNAEVGDGQKLKVKMLCSFFVSDLKRSALPTDRFYSGGI